MTKMDVEALKQIMGCDFWRKFNTLNKDVIVEYFVINDKLDVPIGIDLDYYCSQILMTKYVCPRDVYDNSYILQSKFPKDKIIKSPNFIFLK